MFEIIVMSESIVILVFIYLLFREKRMLKDAVMNLGSQQMKNHDLEKQLVQAQGKVESLTEIIDSRDKDRATMEQLLQTQIKSLAQEVFIETTEKLGKTSEKNISTLLAPLQEKLHNFEHQVRQSYYSEGRERHALKSQIEQLMSASQSLSGEAQALTSALRGSTKVQGDWGENRLELILQSSGLQEGREYIKQGTGMSLRNDEGDLQKPDFLIKIPEQKHIIIDSKVTLNTFFEWNQMEPGKEKDALGKKYLDCIRKHVTDLSSKDYEINDRLKTPEFVLMFCPIEPAFILALQLDPNLLKWAWQKRVVLTGPSTLMANLQTVAALWAHHKQIHHAMEIAKCGGQLYDKFVGFVEDLEGIGNHIDKTQNVYHKAKNKLVSGKGNLIRTAEKLKELGAKSKKSLPQLTVVKAEDNIKAQN